MSNKFAQPASGAALEEFLATAGNNPQALVLSAYLEEKQQWEKLVKQLTMEKLNQIKAVADIGLKLETAQMEAAVASRDALAESKFKVFWCNLVGLKTLKHKYALSLVDEVSKIEVEFKEAEGKFHQLQKDYEEIASNPPSTDRWELAMMGNKLFSAKR